MLSFSMTNLYYEHKSLQLRCESTATPYKIKGYYNFLHKKSKKKICKVIKTHLQIIKVNFDEASLRGRVRRDFAPAHVAAARPAARPACCCNNNKYIIFCKKIYLVI